MAIHLLETIGRAGLTGVHLARNDMRRAKRSGLKTVTSIFPGGAFLTHFFINKAAIDLIEGDTSTVESAVQGAARMAERNAGDVLDSVQDSIDSMGDCDGIAEISDIFGNFL